MVCTTVYSHLIRKSCYTDDWCQEVFALKKYDLLVEKYSTKWKGWAKCWLK